MSAWPRRVCILGLGLIGGSLALALRRRHPGVAVSGVDPDPQARKLAVEVHAVDVAFATPREGARDCDLVMLAAPVDAILEGLPQLPDAIGQDALVTDVGSTKAAICAAGFAALGPRFVGGHPFAGAEHSGLAAADPFLFQNALYALTPLTPDHLNVSKLKGFLTSLGAEVVTLPPDEHDRITAHLSHLPQLVATALCDLVCDRAQTQPLYRALAAGSFRDLTRVAQSSYAVWHSILRNNQTEVDAALAAFQDQLQRVRDELRRDALAQRFERAATFRRELPWRSKGLLTPLHRIALVVEDRPGALVEALGVLAAQGINLKDLELRRTREGDGSTFHFYVESGADAATGARALSAAGWPARLLR